MTSGTEEIELERLLTILCPTRNRPEFVAVWLKHHQFAQVLVLDDSDQELRQPPSSNVIIFPEALPMHEKLLAARAFVTTPFVAVCADDDFLQVDTLRVLVSVMQEAGDISYARGRTLRLFNSLRSPRDLQSPYPDHEVGVKLTKVEAARAIFGNYSNGLFDCYQTNFFFDITDLTLNCVPTSNHQFLQALFDFAKVALGTCFLTNDLYQVRNHLHDNWGKRASTRERMAITNNSADKYLAMDALLTETTRPLDDVTRNTLLEICYGHFSRKLSAAGWHDFSLIGNSRRMITEDIYDWTSPQGCLRLRFWTSLHFIVSFFGSYRRGRAVRLAVRGISRLPSR